MAGIPSWRCDEGLAVQARNCRRTRHHPVSMSEIETAARVSGLVGYNMMWYGPQQSRKAVSKMVGVVARSARWHCKCLDRRIAVLVVSHTAGRDPYQFQLVRAGSCLCEMCESWFAEKQARGDLHAFVEGRW